MVDVQPWPIMSDIEPGDTQNEGRMVGHTHWAL
jgi:hypothetical protein